MKRCPSCLRKIAESDTFCSYCGEPLSNRRNWKVVAFFVFLVLLAIGLVVGNSLLPGSSTTNPTALAQPSTLTVISVFLTSESAKSSNLGTTTLVAIKTPFSSVISSSDTPKPSDTPVPITTTAVKIDKLNAKISVDFIYVLYGPGWGFKAIVGVNRGDDLEVVGISTDRQWLVVKTGDQMGWILRNSCENQDQFDLLPAVESPPTPTPQPTLTPLPTLEIRRPSHPYP